MNNILAARHSHLHGVDVHGSYTREALDVADVSGGYCFAEVNLIHDIHARSALVFDTNVRCYLSGVSNFLRRLVW